MCYIMLHGVCRPFAPWEGCCVCWEDEDRKHILLCDKCDAEYHTYCLEPPLEDVPEGRSPSYYHPHKTQTPKLCVTGADACTILISSWRGG